MNYDAILLTSFGGPESPAEVMPFLERVTKGRGVPRERLEEVSHHYLALGGVSPINEQNRQLLAALKVELLAAGISAPIYFGNRNSAPFYKDTLREIYQDGHRKVLALVTSAYSSYSGCRQYRENLAGALQELELELEFAEEMVIDKVRQYFDHPGFIAPFGKSLAETLANFLSAGVESSKTEIFFTTHSIPLTMAESSGPPIVRDGLPGGTYVAQHLAAAQAVIDFAKKSFTGDMPKWSLAYQSRSGAPQTPWLEPDISDAMERSAAAGISTAILIPIGFISDHVEVIWDLDNEAAERAEELGMEFIRIATPGTSPEFVKGLVELIAERSLSGERKALSPLGPWRDACSVGCCPNPRAVLPAVAQTAEL